MKSTTLYILLLIGLTLKAQDPWAFPEPEIATGAYAITDTVYMSPTGVDTNSGTFNQPVATFQKALQLLPFGTAGINDGNAYGLVRLLPGKYVLPGGLQQGNNQYQNGNTYKNVSIEGIGNVSVQGTIDTFITGHAVRLQGSHIFVKNLTLRYAELHGILINGNTRPKHVLIDSVTVDSVGGFCMLLSDVDTILVRNSRALRGSRPGSESLTAGCAWPSGIKFYGCSWATIHHSEIAYTRGEGLNFQNSEYGLAYNNFLHDNPSNIYCDNSARIIIRNNINYATPGNTVYWRTCPADTNPIYGSTGILLANEGACGVGGPNYQFCTTICQFENRSFKQIDSIFIYNNFFINTTPALSLWQGVTAVPGFNCLRNIFFHHNTVIGLTGDSTAGNAAIIYAFFPNFYNTALNQGFAIGENINVYGNIITYDTKKYNTVQPVLIIRNQNFPVPFDITIAHNRWIEPDTELDTTNHIDTTMQTGVDAHIDSVLKYFQPCTEHMALVHAVPATPWIEQDFTYQTRSTFTNVGALEYTAKCEIEDTVNGINETHITFKVFPNPANELLIIERSPPIIENMKLIVRDVTGKECISKHWDSSTNLLQLSIDELKPGLYFIGISNSYGIVQYRRFVKL